MESGPPGNRRNPGGGRGAERREWDGGREAAISQLLDREKRGPLLLLPHRSTEEEEQSSWRFVVVARASSALVLLCTYVRACTGECLYGHKDREGCVPLPFAPFPVRFEETAGGRKKGAFFSLFLPP